MTRLTDEQRELAAGGIGLALSVSMRKASSAPPWVADDTVSDAMLGLVEAAARFDRSAGNEFSTYAVPRIRGAILDGRRRSGLKGYRRKEGPDGFRWATDAPAVGALGSWVAGREDVPPVEARLLSAWCDARHLRAGLPVRDRVAAYLYYVEGMSMNDVGESLGVTRSRVSQMVTSFLEGVGNALRDEPGCDGGEAEGERGGEADGGASVGCVRGLVEPVGAGPDARGGADGGDARGPVPAGDAVGVGDGRGGAPAGAVRQEELRPASGPGGPGCDGVPGGGWRPEGEGGVPAPADAAPAVAVGVRVSRLAARCPDPAEVAAKAAALRAAMLDAVGVEDVKAVVAAMVKKGRNGNVAAAKVVLQISSGGKWVGR